MLTAQTLPFGTKRGCFFGLVVFLLVMYSCRFMKSTRLESFQRDRGVYGKRVRFTSKASIGNIGVFSLIETGKEQYMCWRERPTLSLYPNAIGKTSLTCQTYLYDCMRTKIGRAVRRHTLGIVVAIICNIDKWFNINYFNVCCQIMKIDTLI